MLFIRKLVLLLAGTFLASISVFASENPTLHFKSMHSKYFVEPSGQIYAKGILSKEDSGSYSVDGQTFKVANGVTVNGTHFNEQSIGSFKDKAVEVLLKTNSAGELELSAIVPADLYSSISVNVLSQKQSTLLNSMINPKTGELKGSLRSPIYSEQESFRATLVNLGSVRSGDTALILTLSGHQADDFGAKGGHFAFGRGQVGTDGKLYSEISNFYPVVNEKLIRLGHGNTIDYFGNITAGQNNYRPTWTAIIYGLNDSEIASAQNNMNGVFEFLEKTPNFEFTFSKNCSTESVKAISDAKISLYLGRNEIDGLAKNIPRKTFEKALKAAFSKSGIKAGVKRIDLVYQSQTPSQRVVGGLPIGGAAELVILQRYFKKEPLVRN